MADEDDVPVLFDLAFGLTMDLADERASGVDIEHFAPVRLGRNGFGHAMGAEHDRGAIGHLVQLLDEDRALLTQRIDDVAVVDDLVADIDRRAVFFERPLHDLDRAVDSGAESAGGRDEEHQRRFLGRVAGNVGQGARMQGRVHAPTPSALCAPSLGEALSGGPMPATHVEDLSCQGHSSS